jgi:hypothetical protein
LEKAVVAARQLVPGSSSGTNHTSPSSSSYEETVVAGLHLQAAAVLNVHSLVNIVLDSTSYASWRDLMMMVLERYALLDHVNSDVASSTDSGWHRMDSVVLNWISNSITPELHQVFGNVVPPRATCGSLSRTSFSKTVSSAPFTLMLPSITLCRVISP